MSLRARKLSHFGQLAIGSAVVFAVIGGLYRSITDHPLPSEFVWCYWWACSCLLAFIGYMTISEIVEKWKEVRKERDEQATAMAKDLKQILELLKDIERTLGL